VTKQLTRIGDLLERYMSWQGIPGYMPKAEDTTTEVSYTDEEVDAIKEWKHKMGLIEALEAEEGEK